MKPLTKSFLLIFLLLFVAMPLCAQNICSSFYTYLDKKGFDPQVQLLTASGTNNLPYNIIVNFSPKDTKTEHNLVFLFDLEEAYNFRDIIIPVFDDLKEQKYNSSVVFCYQSKLELPRSNIIYGSEIYSHSLNSNSSDDVYIFDLSAGRNAIIPGSNKNNSPSWMLKDIFDALSAAKLTDGLPICYISQVADFTFSKERTLLSFIELDIPCILAQIKDPEKIDVVLKSCISSYEASSAKAYDSHSFMFRFFGKRFWFSEFRIINAIIITIVLGFFFVFCIGFINKNLKREFWQEISTVWYTLPIIYIISYCGFFIGKGFYKLFVNETTINYTVFGFIIMQISIATLMVSVFFMLNLSLQKKYTTRSLDFLLVIDSFINLVIFTLLNISLFPLFLLIFAVAVISLIFRRNWIHIILFIFLIIPFIPYINALFKMSDKQSLHELLINSNAQPFLISLVLLPVYLMWLRILNSMKKRYSKKRVYAGVITAAYVFIILSLIILNKIFYSNKNESSKQIQIIQANEQQLAEYDFSLSYNDHNVFDDIIRQIKIVSKTIPVYTCVKVMSQNPVLYSENDFKLNEQNEAEFLLPLYPADNLEFNYGTLDSIQQINVEQIFYSESDKNYYSIIKSISTEEKK
jgi:hypothetical protein